MPDQDQQQEAQKSQNFIWRFLSQPADNPSKTVFVAFAVCLVASMVVATAAVKLKPLQEANKKRDKYVNVLQVAGLYKKGADVEKAFAQFEPHVLELASGKFVPTMDAKTFDDRAAASDPELSVELAEDPAGIGRKAKFRTIYLLRDEAGKIDKVILPIQGYGLWSTLHGFIAIEEDGNNIYGLQFYEHAETPGLGAEVDNPKWKAQWSGKKLADEEGKLQITVAKTPPPAGKDFHIDALSGATLTSVGVDNLVKFWMGKEGYAKFLANLKAGEI